MKADDLKASILQAAIQGKLTNQDPDDEPASVLVERIREEKHRLVKEGKIKRDKNESFIFKRDGSWFETINGKDERCIDDEIPFEIPDNWTWIRLKSICIGIEYGYTASACTQGNAKLLRITDIQDNYVNWDKVPYCSITAADLCHRQLNINDILIARTGGTVGKSYVVSQCPTNVVFASYLIRIRLVEVAITEFLKLYLNTPLYWSLISASKQGTGIPNVNSTSLGKLLVPIPPIKEQSRIITSFDRVYVHINNYRKHEVIISELEQTIPDKITASILQAAIQGKLTKQDPNDEPASILVERIRDEKHRLVKEGKIKRDKNESFIFERDGSWFETVNGKDERCIDDEIPFDIPKNWTFVRLATISLYDVGGATPSINELKYWNGNIKWASVRDIQSGYLNDTERRITRAGFESCSTNIVPKGELIICTRVGLGKICITGDDIAINQDLRGFIISNRIDRHYLIYYYRNIKLEGSGTTVKGITRNQILNLLIPLPPYNEQHQIVNKLKRLDSVLSSI